MPLRRLISSISLAALAAASAHAAEAGSGEFFEQRVRPVLAEHCYGCHGPAKQKGGLRVDHGALLLKGGDNGPALVAGQPEASRMMTAVGYGDVNLQMPPTGKLPDAVIADLRAWVAAGAAWPEEPVPGAKAAEAAFDLAGRRAAHWAWQPLRNDAPPSVGDAGWPRGAVDRFVLTKLEAAKLRPAPEAPRETLLRRLTYDLTGLPPTPDELTMFQLDKGPEAYERLVDRLLASPRFGEHWGRHWLDLTRYAETYGFEGDFAIKEAWRYRDYVIRALNADVPYDQFVREHLAGDLLAAPRRNAEDGTNESLLATGCWAMHQAQHAPVDVRMDNADRVDNQIDVFSKTFLGLTVSCARCHDHKFDAISTADYYALSGIFRSARQQFAELDPKGAIAEARGKLAALSAQGAAALGTAARAYVAAAPQATAFRLAAEETAVAERIPGEVFEDFNKGYGAWYPSGAAFGDGPTGAGAWMPRDGAARLLPAGVAHSGTLAPQLRGALRSRTFTLAHDRVLLLAAGRSAKVRLVIEGYQLREIMPLLFESTLLEVNHGDEFAWLEMAGLAKYKGCEAYLELLDEGDGYLAVDTIAFADSAAPALPVAEGPGPLTSAVLSAWLAGQADAAMLAPLNTALATNGAAMLGALAPLAEALHGMDEIGRAVPGPVQALAWAEGNGVDQPIFVRGNPKNTGAMTPRRSLEALEGGALHPLGPGSGRLELAERLLDETNPLLPRVMVNRVWQHLFGRGIVPTVDNFGALGQPPSHPELLDYLAREFRADGWSVKRLIKRLVMSAAYRMDSAPLDAAAEEADPANVLLHRMPLRRVEAESVRDAILFVAGTLDETRGGPSVPAYISPFMGGFRKPSISGPMDGNRRRTIYLEVRRNFLPALLQAFDFPTPDTTHGLRNTSNVPAQSLVLMNDPFVAAQAKTWAETLCGYTAMSPEQRVATMYRRALSRAPQPEEVGAAVAFLRAQAPRYGIAEEDGLRDARVWADLCQTIFTLKEFVYIG